MIEQDTDHTEWEDALWAKQQYEQANQRIVALESEKQQLVLDLLSMTDENIALESELADLKSKALDWQTQTVTQGVTISKLNTELAASKRECEGLRDTMQQVKLEMLAEDGEVPATDDDWTMLHGWISQFDQALAARDATEGGE